MVANDVLNYVIATNLIFLCDGMELSVQTEDENHARVIGALRVIRNALAGEKMSMEDFLISRGILDSKNP
jgi:hypothetical protein